MDKSTKWLKLDPDKEEECDHITVLQLTAFKRNR